MICFRLLSSGREPRSNGRQEGSESVVTYKAYKYRIYPNKMQEELIQKTFGCVRFVFNHFLEDRIKAYREDGVTRTFFLQNKLLTGLKREHEWLKEPDKNALQNALRDLNTAYQNFFRRVKNGETFGFPKFKSKKSDRKSYSTANNVNTVRIARGSVRLPKLGDVKARTSRSIPDGSRIVSATISQDPSGKYYVSIRTEREIEEPQVELDPNNALGLDYSSPHFYVDSEGNEAEMPHFYREAENKLAKEQRKLSKMTRGSNNYYKQRIRVARAFEKVRNCRMDWQHKESTRLADKYDFICMEDIDYQDMARGLRLAKATNDNAFGQFRGFLQYKMVERGKKLITIDKWYPSSKLCRFCGSINTSLTLKDREWDCPCGAHLLRDLNAAINIREEGLRLVS